MIEKLLGLDWSRSWAVLDQFRGPGCAVLGAGFRVMGSKNLAHNPHTNFTIRVGLDRAFCKLSLHDPRGGLGWMGWIDPHYWSSLL